MTLHHFLVCLSLMAFSLQAEAQPAEINAQRLAAGCANCHGTNGVAMGKLIPSLAGQSKQALITAMEAFKEGTRPATVMHQIAKAYNAEQIALMAEFFAHQVAPLK